MLLTNVGSWYFNDDNVTYELLSYFDLNDNLIERVSNTNCASMGDTQQCQIGYFKDPQDSTRWCAQIVISGGMSITPKKFYPIPYLPENRTSGQTSWYKMPTTVINTSCPDTMYYSLVNKRLEFYFCDTSTKDTKSKYLINTMNSNFDPYMSTTATYLMGYDVMKIPKPNDSDHYYLAIVYNSTNSSIQLNPYLLATINYSQWYKMVIDFKYDANTSGDSGYHCVFYIYDNSDNLLNTFSGPSITLDPSINTNPYGFRFFEQYSSGTTYKGYYLYIKELKLYQIIS